jgi:CheY-like chemotaxis protein
MYASEERPLVLVVEDEVLVRMMISDLLQEAGFKTVEAADPAEALAILEAREDVSVLVTDVNMPGLDGLALSRHVSANWPKIEIIISSGRIRPAPSEIPERATFIAKPWPNEVLIRRVREALARAVAPRSKPGELADAPIIVSDCTNQYRQSAEGLREKPDA